MDVLVRIGYSPKHWNPAVRCMIPAAWIGDIENEDNPRKLCAVRGKTKAEVIEVATREYPLIKISPEVMSFLASTPTR